MYTALLGFALFRCARPIIPEKSVSLQGQITNEFYSEFCYKLY